MARKTFQDLLVEQQGKTVVFTFGRFNPPTIGHEKLIEKVTKLAKRNGAEPRIYLSFSNDKKKNPLKPRDKIRFLKMMTKFPQIIKDDKRVNTPFVALEKLEQEGFDTIILVVGNDRVTEFQKRMAPFAQKIGIKNFKVISAGVRDPDSKGVEGMSASKMRKAATDGNFELFKKGVSSKINDRFKKELFDKVRKGMGLKKINESVSKIETCELVGVPFVSLDLNQMLHFSNIFSCSSDNVLPENIRICHQDIDYNKASRIAQTANDAWLLENHFYISEDGFLCGDVERYVAFLHRFQGNPIKVKRFPIRIREFFEGISEKVNKDKEKINEKFQEAINENI